MYIFVLGMYYATLSSTHCCKGTGRASVSHHSGFNINRAGAVSKAGTSMGLDMFFGLGIFIDSVGVLALLAQFAKVLQPQS